MTGEQGFNTIEHFISHSGGALLVDKPRDWTSFDVVKKVRGSLRVKKVGHAGTLDPLATGLLILCSMSMTKRIDAFQALPKTYEGSMKLGAVTASYDAATPEENVCAVPPLRLEELQAAANHFTGTVSQLPPMFSAVKVEGKRLYTLARKGMEVERTPREVHIATFHITRVELPEVAFKIECSKGTYVRSLVHDLGQHLGCGAYLSNLRRTAIGAFHVDEAWALDDIVHAAARPKQPHEGVPGGAV
ncbi:MAG: tRNA pseudouridine(55) synthase TruB [Bacteroidia bacterium]|nr:tRNA pseudouridine(55) synthase TruB [Bacteroidia bacterium]